jgi:hypothetical protein
MASLRMSDDAQILVAVDCSADEASMRAEGTVTKLGVITGLPAGQEGIAAT